MQATMELSGAKSSGAGSVSMAASQGAAERASRLLTRKLIFSKLTPTPTTNQAITTYNLDIGISYASCEASPVLTVRRSSAPTWRASSISKLGRRLRLPMRMPTRSRTSPPIPEPNLGLRNSLHFPFYVASIKTDRLAADRRPSAMSLLKITPSMFFKGHCNPLMSVPSPSRIDPCPDNFLASTHAFLRSSRYR